MLVFFYWFCKICWFSFTNCKNDVCKLQTHVAVKLRTTGHKQNVRTKPINLLHIINHNSWVTQVVLCLTIIQRSISVLRHRLGPKPTPWPSHLYHWGKTMGLTQCADSGKYQGHTHTLHSLPSMVLVIPSGNHR